MSFISGMIINGLSRIPGVSHIGRIPGIGKGFRGLSVATGMGVSGTFAYYSYGTQYGSGTTAAYAAVGTNPIVGLALLTAETGKMIGNTAFNYQTRKRTSSFVKSQIDDRFGNLHAMKQYSIQQLSRDHTSKQRVLGNEAFHLHR